MKKILITGANSYIGTSFEKYIKERFPNDYIIDTIDMVDGSWRHHSFTGYDSILHVAGIVHKRESKKNAHLYYEINRDLAIETALKAKSDGAKQFVFLSSMSIYGMDTGIITRDTRPNPKSHYGKSKWEAEEKIAKLEEDWFHVCILRPPMVYGDGCKGNYQQLVKIAKTFPILPDYSNQRSMVSIDVLVQLVAQYIEHNVSGVFFPQNESYVCTCEMLVQIREKMGKKIRITKMLNPLIALSIICTAKGRKAFGNLIFTDAEAPNICENK